MRICDYAAMIGSTGLLVLVAQWAQASGRFVSIRVTEFELHEPDRVREFNDAYEVVQQLEASEQDRVARDLSKLMNSPPASGGSPLSPKEQESLDAAMGFQRIGGRLISRVELAEDEFNKRAWDATRGFSPRVEVSCVVPEGGETAARVWSEALGRINVHTYRVGTIKEDRVQVIHSLQMLDRPQPGQPDSAVEWGPPTKHSATLTLGKPRVGEHGTGAGLVSATFTEVRLASQTERSDECVVEYTPEVAPPGTH